ncbi:MAG: methyltransferase [Hyphomicrobiaceae bacterium]
MKMPPPVIALIAVITLFIVHWMLPFLSIRIPGQSILGGLLILAGIAVAVVAVRGFFQAETTIRPDEVDKASTLVTSGLYRFTRNPMYLGLALLIAGIGLGLGTIFVLSFLLFLFGSSPPSKLSPRNVHWKTFLVRIMSVTKMTFAAGFRF